MRTLITSLTLFAIAAGATVGAAQPCGTPGVYIEVSPSRAAPGQKITVTIVNSSNQTIQLPSSCVFGAISPQSCANTPILNLLCLTVITPIAPNSSKSQTWDQRDNNGQQVGNGDYAFAVRYFDSSGSQMCCPTVTIGCGSFTPYGTGCPDSNGRTPVMSGNGCAAPGGNITLSGKGGPPLAAAALVFGFGRGAIPITPNCGVEFAPFSGVAVQVVLSASGDFSLPVPIPVSIPSAKVTMQFAAIETGPPPRLVVSTGLELQVL